MEQYFFGNVEVYIAEDGIIRLLIHSGNIAVGIKEIHKLNKDIKAATKKANKLRGKNQGGAAGDI